VDWGDLPSPEQIVLADAQTSGGLLISASDEPAERLRESMERRGVAFSEIGRTVRGEAGRIAVRGHLAADGSR
jgi:selenophosphate synthase